MSVQIYYEHNSYFFFYQTKFGLLPWNPGRVPGYSIRLRLNKTWLPNWWKSWLKILWKTPLGSKLLTGILRQFFKFDWINIVNVGSNSHTTKFRFYGRAEEPLNKHWMGVLCTAYRLLICLEINLTNPFVCENSRLWMFRKIIANILTRP